MKLKFDQTRMMEQMHEALLGAISTARVDELDGLVKAIIAKGCTEVVVMSIEDYIDDAPWSIHDAVAQFEGN